MSEAVAAPTAALPCRHTRAWAERLARFRVSGLSPAQARGTQEGCRLPPRLTRAVTTSPRRIPTLPATCRSRLPLRTGQPGPPGGRRTPRP
jgi:hypothetical protein